MRHLGAVPGAKPGERQRRRPARAVYCSAVCGHRFLIPTCAAYPDTRELQCSILISARVLDRLPCSEYIYLLLSLCGGVSRFIFCIRDSGFGAGVGADRDGELTLYGISHSDHGYCGAGLAVGMGACEDGVRRRVVVCSARRSVRVAAVRAEFSRLSPSHDSVVNGPKHFRALARARPIPPLPAR